MRYEYNIVRVAFYFKLCGRPPFGPALGEKRSAPSPGAELRLGYLLESLAIAEASSSDDPPRSIACGMPGTESR